MVTWYSTDGLPPYHGFCLSSDTKPIEKIPNGSDLFEMDTGTSYFFDKENSAWVTS